MPHQPTRSPVPVTRPPHGRRHREDTRRAIVEASAGLFSRRGFSRTSMRDIAAAVGVTEPALYRYFGSKQELLDAVFHERVAQWTDWIAETRQSVPVVEALEHVVLRALRFVEQNSDLLRLILFESLAGDAGALAHHQGMMARWHAGIRVLVSREHDPLVDDAAGVLAEDCVAAVWGIGLQRLLGTDPTPLIDELGHPTERCRTLAKRLAARLTQGPVGGAARTE